MDKTLAECKTEEERLMLLLNLDQSDWAGWLVSLTMQAALIAIGATFVVSVVWAIFS